MSSYFSTRPPVLGPPKICRKGPPPGPILPAWPPTRLIASIIAARTGLFPYEWEIAATAKMAETFAGSAEYNATIRASALELLIIAQISVLDTFLCYWIATRLGTQVGHGTSAWLPIRRTEATQLRIQNWPDLSAQTTADFTFFFQPHV